MSSAAGLYGVLVNKDEVPPAPGQQVTYSYGFAPVPDTRVHGANSDEYLQAADAFSKSKNSKHVQMRESLSRFNGIIIDDSD